MAGSFTTWPCGAPSSESAAKFLVDAQQGDPALNGREQIESAEQKLFTLAETGSSSQGLVGLGQALTGAVEMAAAAYKRDGGLSGLSTGLKDLDQKLGGLHASDLVILAARPSMGKTALGANIAFNVARNAASGAATGRRPANGRRWRGGVLLARNERRAAGHAPACRDDRGAVRPDPQGRDQRHRIRPDSRRRLSNWK